MKSFDYPSPLNGEISDEVIIDPRVIEINGMKFQGRSDCLYMHDYYKELQTGLAEREMQVKGEAFTKEADRFLARIRALIQKDLWFIVYFVLKNPLANHPFIVDAAYEVQKEKGSSLEVYARDHLKTTIISVAKSVQWIINDPQETIGIFSATRPLAIKIQNVIRDVLESPIMKACFPDILWQDPYAEAPKWSEAVEGGLTVKRDAFLKEPTVSSYGLTDGMPTGPHFKRRIYDDIVTQDLQSPEMMQKVYDNFLMSDNLGTRDGTATIVGTFYNHQDPLTRIMNLKDPETGIPYYPMRKKPATIDGTINGKSVFYPEHILARKRAQDLYKFCCQQLLNPTPAGTEKLHPGHLVKVSRTDLPENLYKFMLIDAAGERSERAKKTKNHDCWALGVVGVEPIRGDLGLSNVFILDLVIREMDLIEVTSLATDMYCRNGRILQLGVEKVGATTTEVHIANALKTKNRFVSVENGNLVILRPAARPKESRIESALSYPLKNGKIHYLDTIPSAEIDRLKMEMEKFPVWHDDGIDMLSYTYDVIRDYKFGALPTDEEEKEAKAIARAARIQSFGKVDGWITV